VFARAFQVGVGQVIERDPGGRPQGLQGLGKEMVFDGRPVFVEDIGGTIQLPRGLIGKVVAEEFPQAALIGKPVMRVPVATGCDPQFVRVRSFASRG